jgi:hypothetical protein
MVETMTQLSDITWTSEHSITEDTVLNSEETDLVFPVTLEEILSYEPEGIITDISDSSDDYKRRVLYVPADNKTKASAIRPVMAETVSRATILGSIGTVLPCIGSISNQSIILKVGILNIIMFESSSRLTTNAPCYLLSSAFTFKVLDHKDIVGSVLSPVGLVYNVYDRNVSISLT